VGRLPTLSLLALSLFALDASAQYPPTPAQVSCDLYATRGYCIAMTPMTPGVATLEAECAGWGGTVIGVCPTDDAIATCDLGLEGSLQLHAYHYTGRGPARWTVARARTACEANGGRFQVPYE
jgi:hypothetical protein